MMSRSRKTRGERVWTTTGQRFRSGSPGTTGSPVVRLEGLVRVADAADPDPRPLLLPDLRLQQGRGIDLDVDELAPGLGVTRVTCFMDRA